MDEKLKSENMQKSSFLNGRVGLSDTSDDWLVKLMIIYLFIYIYFRLYHFVVKFSKFSSPQAARGH